MTNSIIIGMVIFACSSSLIYAEQSQRTHHHPCMYYDDNYDASDYDDDGYGYDDGDSSTPSSTAYTTSESKSIKQPTQEITSKSTNEPRPNNEKSSKSPSSSSKAPKCSKIPKGAPPPLPDGEGGLQQQVTSGGSGAFHNSMHSTIVRVMVATAFLWIKTL